MGPKLMIVGASVRAQIESGLAAGFEIHGLDLFADRDSQKLIEEATARDGTSIGHNNVESIEAYSDLLSHDIKTCDGVVLCGGVEQRIELVRELEKQTNLIGPSSKSLIRVRDMVEVVKFLDAWRSGLGNSQLDSKAIGIPVTFGSHLDWANFRLGEIEEGLPGRNWLCKRLGGSGGNGVRSMASDEDVEALNFDGCYLQEQLAGKNVSALYVTGKSKSSSNTTMLGASIQLVGESRLGSANYRYCGSIGPAVVSQDIGLNTNCWEAMTAIGTAIGTEYEMAGVWGIDFLINHDVAFPIDINPRITASAEIYESLLRGRTCYPSLLALHFDACRNSEFNLDSIVPSKESKDLVEGKAILFNRLDSKLKICKEKSDWLMTQNNVAFFGSSETGSSVCDIPVPSAIIESGRPISTIRVRDKTVAKVQGQLVRHSAALFDFLENR